MVLTGAVGAVLILAALFETVAYNCVAVRTECLLDGALCFGIVYAEYRGWSYVIVGLVTISLLALAIWDFGYHFAC